MSTVLRPVGPHEPRIYWIRRGVLLGAVIVIVVVLVVVLSGGGSAKPGAGKHPHTTPSTSSTSPPPVTTVPACDPSVITLALATDSDSYSPGESPKLSGVFSNPSTTACRLVAPAAKQIWTVTSGADKIWTTKGCDSSLPTKRIKLKAGGTKTISITWNGRRLDPGCTSGPAALPGEYVLRATLAGITGKPAVFHVTSA